MILDNNEIFELTAVLMDLGLNQTETKDIDSILYDSKCDPRTGHDGHSGWL